MQKLKVFFISLLCLLNPGCHYNNISYYSNRKNHLDLRSFFNGKLDGWGIILDYKGRQTRSFYVKMKGSWNNNKGILKEWFEFDDNEKTTRQWNINFINNQMFTATAKDVINKASGRQNGNAVNVKYTLQIPYNNKIIEVNMDDWMFLVKDGIILNRVSMKKFGIKVGELIICIKKIN